MTAPDRGPTVSSRDAALPDRLRSLVRRAKKAMLGKRGNQPVHRLLPCQIRPFRRADLDPLPDGGRVTGPHFIGIGTAKSGTSWWFSMLLRHPSVVANRLRWKELSYFPHFLYHGLTDEDVQTYREAFAAPVGKVCGEWSPGYLQYPLAKESITRHFPDARLLVILRDPIDRMISHMNHIVSERIPAMGLREEGASVMFRAFAFPKALAESHYAPDLSRLLQLVDRSRVLVLQYERCKARPLEEYARTCRFLGIDDRFHPPDPQREINRKEYRIPKPSDAVRRTLAGQFQEDMARLKELFPEIDLTLWRTHSD